MNWICIDYKMPQDGDKCLVSCGAIIVSATFYFSKDSNDPSGWLSPLGYISPDRGAYWIPWSEVNCPYENFNPCAKGLDYCEDCHELD